MISQKRPADSYLYCDCGHFAFWKASHIFFSTFVSSILPCSHLSHSDCRCDSNREAMLKLKQGKFVRIDPISGGGWELILPNQNLVRTKQRKQDCVALNYWHYWRIWKFPLNLLAYLLVRMAISEVKKEPTEHEVPTVYEESVLNKINKPPTSKVSRLFVCLFGVKI